MKEQANSNVVVKWDGNYIAKDIGKIVFFFSSFVSYPEYTLESKYISAEV